MNRLLRRCMPLLALLLTAGASAQPLNLSLILSPPYSPYFSDYLTYGNKGLLTVVNSSPTPLNVYFKASVTADVKGIAGATKGDYKPVTPLVINKPTTILRGPDFETYFSLANFTFKGITTQELTTGTGLPEGNYTICIQAFDFNTGAPLSNNACATIHIASVEPPTPQLPLCESSVTPNPAQNVPFNWTVPPGAPLRTRYLLRMVELLPGQNPNDAINSLTVPPFFYKDNLLINTYIYALSDPKLTVGKRYAWQVQAYEQTPTIAFRNNGFSPVCTFTYGGAGAANDSLILISPTCNTGKVTNGLLSYSSEKPLSLGWIWNTQTFDSASVVGGVLKANGDNILQYQADFMPLQKQGAAPAAVPGGKDKAYTAKTVAPIQHIDIAGDAVAATGLMSDHWYNVRIRAIGAAGKILSEVSSCDVRLVKGMDSGKTVQISGTLAYKLEDNGAPFAASNVSITLQLVNTVTHNSGYQPKAVKASVTTDSVGVFSVAVPVDSITKNYGYVDVTINSPYYQQPAKTFPVSLLVMDSVKGSNGQYTVKPTGIKTAASIGQAVVNAYTYTLNVAMGKGFPTYVFDTLTKSYQTPTYVVDTMAINPKVKVKAGIPVVLYRYAKAAMIPRYEGDTLVPAKKDVDKKVRLIVGRGVTVVQSTNGVEKTVVVFKRLLCNQMMGDEYYMQAILPQQPASSGNKYSRAGGYNAPSWHNSYDNPAPRHYALDKTTDGSDDDDFLEAPEQRVVFDLKNLKPEVARYTQNIDYKLISTKPPMSTLKGQLTYAWQSSPGVIRPMPHAKFYVRTRYVINGNKGWPPSPGDCSFTLYTLSLDGSTPGSKTYKPENTLSQASDGIVLGQGETDEQGNFDLQIVNWDTKGTIASGARFYGMKINTCDNAKNATPDPHTADPRDKYHWGELDLGQDKLQQLYGMDHNSQYISNAGNSYTNNGGLTSAHTNGLMNGAGVQMPGSGAGLLGFTNGNIATGNVGGNIGTKMNLKSGPASPMDGAAPDNSGADTPGVKVDRMLEIVLTGDADKFYGQPDYAGADNESNTFAVQAFDTKDLGKLNSYVRETISKKLRIGVRKDNKATPVSLDHAKLTVYREAGTTPKHFPQGEGTAMHPMKELISESVLYKTDPSKKEWVLDMSRDVPSNNRADLSNLALIQGSLGNVWMQIAPDPANGGTRFGAINVPFSTDSVTVDLKPAKLVGRVLEKSSKPVPLGMAKVTLKQTTGSGEFKEDHEVNLLTDTAGYFEYEDGTVIGNNSIALSFGCHMTVSKTGYSKLDTALGKVLFGSEAVLAPVLEPGSQLVFRVVNEAGQDINAFVMRTSDSILFTAQGNKYIIPAATGKKVSLVVIPEDPRYFSSGINSTPVAGVNNITNIILPERLHRMRFNIARKSANGTPIMPGKEPADQFRISINSDAGLYKLSGNGGPVDFSFANVSVNNYTVTIEDNKGTGYIPQSFNVSNTESKDWVEYNVVMKKGGVITGTVTMNGQPANMASVYVEHSGSSGAPAKDSTGYGELKVYTDAAGKYTLSGIPLNSGSIIVHALKGSNTSFIIGDQKTVTLVSGIGAADLALTQDNNLTNNDGLFGYTMSVEKAVKTDNDHYLLSGLVFAVINQGKFTDIGDHTMLRVKDVPFKRTSGGPMGKFQLVAEGDQVAAAESAVKVRYVSKYNVALESPESNGSAPFIIRKGTGGGYINAVAHIVDNSYNYPSTYLDFTGTGDFYLAKKDGNTITNVIPALPAKVQPAWQPALTGKNGDSLSFKFIGFNTKASPAASYIDNNGRIHLDANFRGTVPHSDPGYVNIHMTDLVLDNNSIQAFSGNTPLEMKLESWKLVVNNWTVDPVKGGITSKDAVMQTGVANLKMKTFNLRHDLFVVDDFDPSNINLGAISLEKLNATPTLVYDYKVGSDGGAHWRFNLLSLSSEPAATIYLDDAKQKKLDVDYMQLISYNNENIITIRKSDKAFTVVGNNKINFYPQSLSSNGAAFFLEGDGGFTVPRTPGMHLRVKYTKSGTTLAESLEPIENFRIDGKGYTQFTATAQPTTTDGITSIKGGLWEPGKFEKPIPVTFRFGNTDDGTMVFPAPGENFITTLVGDTKLKLNHPDGTYMKVVQTGNNKDWTTMHIAGDLIDGKQVMADGNRLDLEVLGDIKVSSSNIKADSINTPFGTLNMVFDFPSKTLHGAMHMDGVEFGSYHFTGDVDMNFGPLGFLCTAAGQLNTGTLFAEGFGTFTAGLMLGAYANVPGDAISKVTQFSKNPTEHCWLDAHKTGFKGFYFTGGYDVINTQKGVDIGIASAYFTAVLGIEASLGAIVSTPEIKLGLGAHGKVTAGMSAITGTSIKGSVEAHVTANADLYPFQKRCDVAGTADMRVKAKVCQYIPLLGDECFDFDKSAGANFFISNSPKKADYDFFLGDVNENAACSQKTAGN